MSRATESDRRFVPNALLVVFGIVVGLTLGEVVVRVLPASWLPVLQDVERRTIDLTDLHRPSDNPRLRYELVPGLAEVNTDGYRGTAYPRGRSDGGRRVLGIGNSTAFGLGVAEPDNYLRRLEGLLSATGDGVVEVVNLAVPGYNTHQELERLRSEGLAFQPDLIVLGYDHNDPDPILGRDRPPLPDDYGRNALRSELLRLVLRTLYYAPNLRRTPRTDGYISGGEAWTGHLDALREIGALARDRGVPVVVVAYDAWIVREDHASSVHFRELHEPLHELWRDEGFTVLDCYLLFQEYMAEHDLPDLTSLWVSIDPPDGHPNPRGHEVIAEALADTIAVNALLR